LQAKKRKLAAILRPVDVGKLAVIPPEYYRRTEEALTLHVRLVFFEIAAKHAAQSATKFKARIDPHLHLVISCLIGLAVNGN
jgi:hypothetical protein